jgi:thiamine-phosphate pyrophosphorylase
MTLSEDARTLWQTAKALALKSQAVSLQAPRLPPLLFFTDPQRTPDPRLTASALPAGAAVVYRHFGAPDAEQMARDLRRITREQGLLLLIGQDEGLAEAINADGLHLPERLLNQAPDIRGRHKHWLITGAVHSDQSFNAAKALDACTVSPVFKAGGTSSHKPDLGLDRFTDLCARAPVRVYGLGGITAMRAPLMLDTGACGIAGVDAIQAAFKP